MSNTRGESLLNGAIVVVATCALSMTALAAYRSVRPPRQASASAPPIVAVSNWQRFATAGHRVGPPNAPVTIVEFSDFQCPYCRAMQPILERTLQEYSGRVALVYRHYPLSQIHPHAYEAAVAAECAARQGRFDAYHDSLFAGDSLGARAWTTIAARVGVRDTLAFAHCLTDSVTPPSITRDIADGNALGIVGTPTLLINQYRLTGGAASVDSLVQVLLGPSVRHGRS